MRILGLSGYARSGKDTLAAALVGRGFVQRSFAAGLKDCLLALDPIISVSPGYRLSQVVHEPKDWEWAKDEYPLVRELLQRMGTEVGRSYFGENVWVEMAFRSIPAGASAVLADCRFPNEAEAIRAAGGQVWRIERPGFAPVNAHPSETALDGFDFDRHIFNLGTVDDLRAAALDLAP